ncbi:MAG: hypothetical protein ACR2QG_03970, partial [Gammaproteobacteria bacterium]
MHKNILSFLVGMLSCFVLTSANAVTFPNLAGPGPDLPNGEISFADAVTVFTPGFVLDDDLGVNVPL